MPPIDYVGYEGCVDVMSLVAYLLVSGETWKFPVNINIEQQQITQQ